MQRTGGPEIKIKVDYLDDFFGQGGSLELTLVGTEGSFSRACIERRSNSALCSFMALPDTPNQTQSGVNTQLNMCMAAELDKILDGIADVKQELKALQTQLATGFEETQLLVLDGFSNMSKTLKAVGANIIAQVTANLTGTVRALS